MGQSFEPAATAAHEQCCCGQVWIGPEAPHRVHGDPAVIQLQVMGAPKYGREAHTVRECYREVCSDASWRFALDSWRASLRHGQRPEPAPMPVGHLMFAPVAGCAGLSRRDNAAREIGGQS
jgi:hypothetical protein